MGSSHLGLSRDGGEAYFCSRACQTLGAKAVILVSDDSDLELTLELH